MPHGLSFLFFKKKTAYEIPKRDWSSDVCSSDLGRDPDGFHATLLHTAAYNGQTAVVEDLLRRNADVNARTTQGHTPLYDAADRGTPQVVALLLQHGADVTIRAEDTGWTPLQAALSRQRSDIAEALRQHGAKE